MASKRNNKAIIISQSHARQDSIWGKLDRNFAVLTPKIWAVPVDVSHSLVVRVELFALGRLQTTWEIFKLAKKYEKLSNIYMSISLYLKSKSKLNLTQSI